MIDIFPVPLSDWWNFINTINSAVYSEWMCCKGCVVTRMWSALAQTSSKKVVVVELALSELPSLVTDTAWISFSVDFFHVKGLRKKNSLGTQYAFGRKLHPTFSLLGTLNNTAVELPREQLPWCQQLGNIGRFGLMGPVWYV